MSANDKQIGGDHYKKGGEEHWDRQWRLYGRGYFIGCITKYVERYPEKNGVQDLQKAIHFIEKLIELEQNSVQSAVQPESPVSPVHPEAYKDSLSGGWLVEGFYGDMTQNYKCPVCRQEVRATSFGHALEQHGACSGSKLSVP